VASVALGRFALTGRLWEGVVVDLGSQVPLEWAKQLFGYGHAAPPIRGLAVARDVAASSPLAALDLSAGWGFVGRGLGGGLSLPLWILAGLGLVRSAGERSGRRVLVVLAGASAAQVAATALAQARNAALPLSNLGTPLAASLVLVAAGAVALSDAAPQRRRVVVAWCAAAVAVAVGARWSPAAQLLPGVERRAPGAQAAADLAGRVAPGEPVVASFATGGVALRAERRWVPWPAPWDVAAWPAGPGPRWALLSSLDGGLPSPVPPGVALEPVALYRDGSSWVAVAAVRDTVSAE
jgi:hypothetical protein